MRTLRNNWPQVPGHASAIAHLEGLLAHLRRHHRPTLHLIPPCLVPLVSPRCARYPWSTQPPSGRQAGKRPTQGLEAGLRPPGQPTKGQDPKRSLEGGGAGSRRAAPWPSRSAHGSSTPTARPSLPEPPRTALRADRRTTAHTQVVAESRVAVLTILPRQPSQPARRISRESQGCLLTGLQKHKRQ